MRWLALLLVCLGCDDAQEGEPVAPIQDLGVVTDGPAPSVDLGRDPTPCDRPELWAQCPPGSNPTVTVDGCVEGAEITDQDGNTTGVCARQGECLFACNFQDPCPCGIDRITAGGVFCSDCREASACGDAVCDRGENPGTCAVDCGETCLADNERCNGNARQECEENGRWATLDCRDDQLCQFGDTANKVVTVCQTRISMAGGTFPGFGAQDIEVTGDSQRIRFRETGLDGRGIRFVEGGERVLAVGGDNRVIVLDPTGERPPEVTNIRAGGTVVASPNRIVRAGRWPQLSEFFDDTSRTVEPIVHDGASASPGAVALSGDDRWMVSGFAVGLAGGTLEPFLAIWRAEDGRINHLVRFVDEAVVQSTAPATAVTLSLDGAAAVEARPGGILIVWNVQERRYAHLIQSDVGEVTQLVTSVAGDDLLAVGGSRGVELWEIGDRPERRWFIPVANVRALAIAPDSSTVAYTEARVQLVDAADGGELFSIVSPNVPHLDFDPRGGRLLVGEAIYTFEL